MNKNKFSMSHFFKNNLGVTLVEIMVATGLLGIIGLGVANLSKVGGQQNIAFRQNNVVETAIGRINRVLSRADTCSALGANITLAEVQGLAAPVLEAGVTIVNVQMIRVPANPVADLGLGEGESGTVQIQLLVTFNKANGNNNRTVNRIAYARHIYENPNGPSVTQYTRCANYEADSSRAAFEANCRTIGGTVRVTQPGVLVDPWVQQPAPPAPAIAPTSANPKNYWCDFSTIDDTKYFTDKVRKEICEVLFGNVNSYDAAVGVKRCRDMLVDGTMTGANLDPTRIGLSNGAGGYNFRTTFDQNACADLSDPNAFITGVNIDGTVDCATIDWCVQGTSGCGPWAMSGSSINHCTTNCGCANDTQADATENDFGDHDGDGGVNTCRPEFCDGASCGPTLPPGCAASRTERLGDGQYDEGGSDFLTYKCYGLDCDFKDYFAFTLGDPATDNTYDNVLSVGLFETPDLTSANQVTSCGTPVLTSSRTAGVCAIFEPYVFTQVANYAAGNDTVPDSNGLSFANLNDTSSADPFISDGGIRNYGTAADLCNGGAGRCRSGGPGPSGQGTSASAGNCCSLEFDTQPGSGDQCGNPMQDDCGNVDLPGDPTVSRWSTQCVGNDPAGNPQFCEFNGVDVSNSNDWSTVNPSSSSTCCNQEYNCGDNNIPSLSSCRSAGSTFTYCAPGTGSCSRDHQDGQCCLPSYSCAESPAAECLNYGSPPSVHNTCGGSVPFCLGAGPSATCVECNDTNSDGWPDGASSCTAGEYCASNNTCQPDNCTPASVDTDTQACTPTAAEASCDTANGETPVAMSGTHSRTRTCNSSGSQYGNYSSFGSCSGGSCACTATLPAANTVACGSSVSNCAGTVNGSYCSAANTTCNSGTCVPDQCSNSGAPSVTGGSFPSSGNTSTGSSLSGSCDSGYSGSISVQCTDGSWGSVVGSCSPVAGYCVSNSDCGVQERCSFNTCMSADCSLASKPSSTSCGISGNGWNCCEIGWQCNDTICDAPGTIGN